MSPKPAGPKIAGYLVPHDLSSLEDQARSLSFACRNRCRRSRLSTAFVRPADRLPQNFGSFQSGCVGPKRFPHRISKPASGPRPTFSSLGGLASDPDCTWFPSSKGSVTSLDESGQPASQLRLIGLDSARPCNLPSIIDDPIEFAEEESTWHEWLGSPGDVWPDGTRPPSSGLSKAIPFPSSRAEESWKFRSPKYWGKKDSNLGAILSSGTCPRYRTSSAVRRNQPRGGCSKTDGHARKTVIICSKSGKLVG